MTVGPYDVGRLYEKFLLPLYFFELVFLFSTLLNNDGLYKMSFTIFPKNFDFLLLRLH